MHFLRNEGKITSFSQAISVSCIILELLSPMTSLVSCTMEISDHVAKLVKDLTSDLFGSESCILKKERRCHFIAF